MNAAISVTGLTITYGGRMVTDRLSFTVAAGSVVGFLGRNGAGKSSTLRCLLGLQQPLRGGSSILGHDSQNLPPEVRDRIGYLSENHPLHGWMTVAEAGWFHRSTSRRWRDDLYRTVLGYFDIRLTTRCQHLSRGERAGVCLAMTLAGDPDVLILDDPALGLDPLARSGLLEALAFLTRRENRTLLFSSHQLADVDRLADRILVLDGGTLRADCPLETFRSRFRRVVLGFAGPPPPVPALPGLLQIRRANRELVITHVGDDQAEAHLAQQLGAIRCQPAALDLDEAFIAFLAPRGEKTLLFPVDGTGERS